MHKDDPDISSYYPSSWQWAAAKTITDGGPECKKAIESIPFDDTPTRIHSYQGGDINPGHRFGEGEFYADSRFSDIWIPPLV